MALEIEHKMGDLKSGLCEDEICYLGFGISSQILFNGGGLAEFNPMTLEFGRSVATKDWVY